MGGEEGGHEGSNIGEIQPDLPNQKNHFVSVLQTSTALLQNNTHSMFPVQNYKFNGQQVQNTNTDCGPSEDGSMVQITERNGL